MKPLLLHWIYLKYPGWLGGLGSFKNFLKINSYFFLLAADLVAWSYIIVLGKIFFYNYLMLCSIFWSFFCLARRAFFASSCFSLTNEVSLVIIHLNPIGNQGASIVEGLDWFRFNDGSAIVAIKAWRLKNTT